jgi:hypothetical protein
MGSCGPLGTVHHEQPVRWGESAGEECSLLDPDIVRETSLVLRPLIVLHDESVVDASFLEFLT